MVRKPIPIRINFEGDDAERFEAVKKYLGIKSNTEAIRALVSEAFHKIPSGVSKEATAK